MNFLSYRAYRHTDRQKDTQTDRHTDTDTHRHTQMSTITIPGQ